MYGIDKITIRTSVFNTNDRIYFVMFLVIVKSDCFELCQTGQF